MDKLSVLELASVVWHTTLLLFIGRSNAVKRPSYRWRPRSTTNLKGTVGNNGNTKGTKDTNDGQPPSPVSHSDVCNVICCMQEANSSTTNVIISACSNCRSLYTLAVKIGCPFELGFGPTLCLVDFCLVTLCVFS